MKIVLAPMEGVLDPLMRDLLSAIGGYDWCVTEFIRVVDQTLPDRVFIRLCPELLQGGKTRHGVPVRVQLLGQDPDWLAENAATAVRLGSPGIDLNFGCPAKTVNKSRGGAVLLQYPEVLYRIVQAVRAAVPAHLPVTAKMRLGLDDPSMAMENAHALASAGATSLAIHARTKRDGYRPPAYWSLIKPIVDSLSIPVIANGEIWNAEQAQQCQRQSGTCDIMLGRGALAMPNLASVIRHQHTPYTWQQVLMLLLEYSRYEIEGDKGLYYPNRIKQWCSYLRLQYPEADTLFQTVRTFHQTPMIVTHLQAQLATYSLEETAGISSAVNC